MAAIWTDIEITWKGEAHKIRPTLDFINHLEQRDGHTLPNLVMQLTNGKLGSASSCAIVSDALNYVGVKVTPDEVFEEFSGVSREMFSCAWAIVASCLPQPKQAEGVVKKKIPKPPKPPANRKA